MKVKAVKVLGRSPSKLVKATRSKRNLHFRSHHLSQSVVTIGYKVEGLAAGQGLKENAKLLKERLGGKAAGLVEINRLGIPVPPAFNLSTELCGVYLMRRMLPDEVLSQCRKAMAGLERALGKSFGSSKNPLLVSVRSGARTSMPGMMDTVLNLGLNTKVTSALAVQNPNRARFWWDCYRRLIQMYSNVVLNADHSAFEHILTDAKNGVGVESDADLSAATLRKVCEDYLKYLNSAGLEFPEDPWTQLTQAIEAVFRSWNTDRAIHYRKLNKIPDDWGTSVTIQAMVFGNFNDRSATGVVFTRDPSTGANEIYGEYLLNAQGEDVVAGIRTPKPILEMKSELPKVYSEFTRALALLEKHFNEVQDIEFTIEDSRLYILQTRNAKRTARAALEHIVQFVKEKKWTPAQAVQQLPIDQVKQLLHPTLKPTEEKPIAKGLPASPGAVSGLACFSPESAVERSRAGLKTILVRRETSPEDIMGMAVSEGILTSTGGMTSHAAVVGRGMGKSCVVGCSDLFVNESSKSAEVGVFKFEEGDEITLNGSTGEVYLGSLPTAPTTWGASARTFFSWADQNSRMPVLANADTPEQARLSVELGARGIGLCRTEHMFFDKERIRIFRLMILTESLEERVQRAKELEDFQRSDFVGIFKAMKGFSVCVRLLDPPLHEFLPKLDERDEIANLSKDLKISEIKLRHRIEQLHEANPMLGHRGCRLGVTFPEIYSMQVRALATALVECLREKSKTTLKIMIPLVMSAKELAFLLDFLKSDYETAVRNASGEQRSFIKAAERHTRWGTMIELPRACVIANEIAPLVDFVSFGTNDLTQTTMGISRDDAAKFVPAYIEHGLLKADPFESLDLSGVGRLIALAVNEGRKVNPHLEVGICGEHGGDPDSIRFFNQHRFNSISCSPYRVPVARLGAALAELESGALKLSGLKSK